MELKFLGRCKALGIEYGHVAGNVVGNQCFRDPLPRVWPVLVTCGCTLFIYIPIHATLLDCRHTPRGRLIHDGTSNTILKISTFFLRMLVLVKLGLRMTVQNMIYIQQQRHSVEYIPMYKIQQYQMTWHVYIGFWHDLLNHIVSTIAIFCQIL